MAGTRCGGGLGCSVMCGSIGDVRVDLRLTVWGAPKRVIRWLLTNADMAVSWPLPKQRERSSTDEANWRMRSVMLPVSSDAKGPACGDMRFRPWLALVVSTRSTSQSTRQPQQQRLSDAESEA